MGGRAVMGVAHAAGEAKSPARVTSEANSNVKPGGATWKGETAALGLGGDAAGGKVGAALARPRLPYPCTANGEAEKAGGRIGERKAGGGIPDPVPDPEATAAAATG